MSDLIPRNPAGMGFVETRTQRQANRAIDRVRAHQAVATAQQVGRVEIVQQTAQASLVAASHISTLEALLGSGTTRVEVHDRLRAIAEAGCVGLSEIVLDTTRRCR
jgi:hypothetical protein